MSTRGPTPSHPGRRAAPPGPPCTPPSRCRPGAHPPCAPPTCGPHSGGQEAAPRARGIKRHDTRRPRPAPTGTGRPTPPPEERAGNRLDFPASSQLVTRPSGWPCFPIAWHETRLFRTKFDNLSPRPQENNAGAKTQKLRPCASMPIGSWEMHLAGANGCVKRTMKKLKKLR